MRFIPTSLPGVMLIEPQVFEDGRGFFMETYQRRKFHVPVTETEFVQENHSGSKKGVLRGIHYQLPNPQGKLVRVIRGEVFDVAVDLRRNSATFGKWLGEVLSESNRRQLWVPPGFGHGFYVQSEWAEVVYKVTDYWAPHCEKTLRWDDPQLNIAWPIPAGEGPVISAKDAAGFTLAEAPLYHGDPLLLRSA